MASASDNFKFPFALSIKKRKTFHVEDLPQFNWKEISGQEVLLIGQGAFGAVFITSYDTAMIKPSETVVVKKLLSTATDFQQAFVKEARLLHGLRHDNVVQFKARVLSAIGTGS